MAGWDLKCGELHKEDCSDDKLWALFNFVFSDSCSKRSTYKYGLIKSILDNLFNLADADSDVISLSFDAIFEKFAVNYWNLVSKYNLKQMRPDGKSEFSGIEKIIKDVIAKNNATSLLEYDSLDDSSKKIIVSKVKDTCKKNVIGALYENFEGYLYGFNLSQGQIWMSRNSYEFCLKYKYEIEKLNYYAWAKFLESINDDTVLIRVLDKLEISTPQRNDLSMYRRILAEEFEQNTCFYCGSPLSGIAHVDHFIPWSFIKDDKLWNMVLACPKCNIKKNNKIPEKRFLIDIQQRNTEYGEKSELISREFIGYNEDLLGRVWRYSLLCGLKEFRS